MPIERSSRPVAAEAIAEIARRLLDASTLCAIATVTPEGSAHVNTAYFAWTAQLDVVWLSDPDATHSRNLGSNVTSAIAVYDSGQSWGGQDHGIQLFGPAVEAEGAAASTAEAAYASRFPAYRRQPTSSYRFYVFRPTRVKLFHERELGGGCFVTATVDEAGRLVWAATEIYRPAS